jgi:hypothetical protein
MNALDSLDEALLTSRIVDCFRAVRLHVVELVDWGGAKAEVWRPGYPTTCCCGLLRKTWELYRG